MWDWHLAKEQEKKKKENKGNKEERGRKTRQGEGEGKKAGMGYTVLHFWDTQDMPVELTYRLISNEQK